MAPDREDWDRTTEKRKWETVKRREREITQVAQATVPMTALMGDPNWDFFLSMLQSKVEELATHLTALHDAQEHDMSCDPVTLSQQKARMMASAVQKATLEQVIALPKQIIEKGESARLVLEKYVEE